VSRRGGDSGRTSGGSNENGSVFAVDDAIGRTVDTRSIGAALRSTSEIPRTEYEVEPLATGA
jgi:hypothetical protein